MDGSSADGWLEDLLAEGPWLRRLAQRLVSDPTSADDLAQATYAAALTSPPPASAPLRAWLTTVARNLVRKQRRTETRRTYRERRVATATPQPAADDIVARQELRQHVGDAVLGLDEPYRTTILLRFFEGLPPRDVATRMGVGVETVRTRTRRAIARLRERLDRECGSRERWIAMILPFADLPVAPPPGAAAPSAAGVVGGLLMATLAKKTVMGAGVVLFLAAGGTAVHLAMRSESPAPEETGGVASVTDPHVGAAEEPRRERQRVAQTDGSSGAAPHGEDEHETAATQRVVRVELVREDGGPTAAARVALFGDTQITTGAADDSGVVELVAPPAVRGVIAAVSGMPPVVAAVAPHEDDVSLTIPQGLAIEGIVRVNGAAPTLPVELLLHASSPERAFGPVPLEVIQQLADAGISRWGMPAVADLEGRFRFSGLAQSERKVMLEFGPRWALVETGDTYTEVAIPSRDHVIDLAYRGLLSGRILAPGGAHPARAVRLVATFFSAEPERTGGASSWRMTRSAEEDGTFGAGMPPWAEFRLKLTVVSDDGFLETEIDAPPPGRDLALGDLELSPFQVARVRAVDEAGLPIEGTVAWEVASQEVAKVVTAHGSDTVSLRFTRLRGRVRVGALGYRVAEAEVGADGDVHTLRLERAPVLSVQVTGAPDGAVVRLDAGAPLFDTPGGAEPSRYVVGGYSSWGSSGTRYWYKPTQNEPITIGSLVADRDVEVVLHDRLGTVLDREVVRLTRTDRRSLELRAEGAMRSVSGAVRDSDGKPLHGARVAISDADDNRSGAVINEYVTQRDNTDAHGRFSIAGVRAQAIEIVVYAEGSVPWFRRRVPVSAEGVSLDIRLERGRDVTLQPVNGRGEPLRGALVEVQSDDLPLFAWDDWLWEAYDDDGTWVLRDVPRESFRVRISHGTGEEPFEVPRDANSVRVTVE